MARILATADPGSERRFEVSLSDWYREDEEQTGPWCIDHGDRIEVLRTREIHRQLQQGHLDPELRVWRDGRACWLPIAECYELTVTPPPVVVPTAAVEPIGPPVAAAPPSRRRTLIGGVGVQRLGAIVAAAFVVGMGLGALVVLPARVAPARRAHEAAVEHAFDEIEQAGVWSQDRSPRLLVAR